METQQQKPTVGRIVHYYPSKRDEGTILNNISMEGVAGPIIKDGTVLPAIIVQVWSDTCVNLRVICDGPKDAWKTSVTLFGSAGVAVDEYEKAGSWEWPPRS
jgi:hypothetical protein